MASQWGYAKTRHVQGREPCSQKLFPYRVLLELVLHDVPPEILDKPEKYDMEDLDWSVLVGIQF